jgi:hypothetical protein
MWEVCFTLNPHDIIASVVFLFVDILTFSSAILFVVSLWRQPYRAVYPLEMKKRRVFITSQLFPNELVWNYIKQLKL